MRIPQDEQNGSLANPRLVSRSPLRMFTRPFRENLDSPRVDLTLHFLERALLMRRRAFLCLALSRRNPQVARPGADSIRTMADILTLPQPAQTRKSTGDGDLEKEGFGCAPMGSDSARQGRNALTFGEISACLTFGRGLFWGVVIAVGVGAYVASQSSYCGPGYLHFSPQRRCVVSRFL
jgi:hypothetical protein